MKYENVNIYFIKDYFFSAFFAILLADKVFESFGSIDKTLSKHSIDSLYFFSKNKHNPLLCKAFMLFSSVIKIALKYVKVFFIFIRKT